MNDEIDIVSQNIFDELNNPSIIDIKDIKKYLINKESGTEVFLKIKYTKSYKEYKKKKFKNFLDNCPKINKNSFFFTFEEYKFEITEDYKAFIVKRNKRVCEFYFNKDADNLLDFFGYENDRLAEAFILAKKLDLRDFLYKNDGRGLNLI